MKYARFTTIGLGVILLIYAAFSVYQKNTDQKMPKVGGPSQTQEQQTQQEQSNQKLETKTDEQGGVSVAVTPTDISAESKEWQFAIVMNTHSIELDQDLVKLAVLIDDQGKEYKPARWEGPTGGHHREGTLVFEPVAPAPQSIELKINGIAGAARVFTWQLNK